MTKKRDNFVQAWTPFHARWNSSPLLFRCKNCKHEYIVDIAQRGYSVEDVALRTSENGKKFWSSKFQCPKCKNYTPPVILVLDINPRDIKIKSFNPIEIQIDNDKWKEVSKNDNSKLLILDDYKMLKNKTK